MTFMRMLRNRWQKAKSTVCVWLGSDRPKLTATVAVNQRMPGDRQHKPAWPRNDICEICSKKIHLNLRDVWIHDDHCEIRYRHIATPKTHKGIGTVGCIDSDTCGAIRSLLTRERGDEKQFSAAVEQLCQDCQVEAKGKYELIKSQ